MLLALIQLFLSIIGIICFFNEIYWLCAAIAILIFVRVLVGWFTMQLKSIVSVIFPILIIMLILGVDNYGIVNTLSVSTCIECCFRLSINIIFFVVLPIFTHSKQKDETINNELDDFLLKNIRSALDIQEYLNQENKRK